ncbi:tRNA-guanine transglycosylase [Halomicrobium sp. HM KBTZ05]|uniref:tRNA-guanine transglycosylase n=1 Tax=Halomicrobium sp. HM KBTZ05 TaxID=3242663 RepID=UPI003557F5AD
METPNLFPVINFYGGGTSNSVYGGSAHRSIKELINGAERMCGLSCSDAFPGAMMSVGSLTDYGISKKRLEDYLDETIHQRPEFHGFDGILFTDSGGYKNLTKGGLDGSDFEIELDQERVFKMQKQLGGDILINLDYPILESDSDAERREKARDTAENAVEFLELAEDSDFDGAKYLSVHGFYYSQLETFMSVLTETFGTIDIENAFDGIALGSLVPKKDNKGDLIRAVRDCREVMAEYGLESLPLHVLGISSSAIPLLVAVGADTFDSSSYIHGAVNGKYYKSLAQKKPVQDVDLTECPCPICSSPEFRSRIRGDVEYDKDRIGPLAVHNQYVQQRELVNIRDAIEQPGTDGLVQYIEDSVGRNRRLRRQAHQVVEEHLGGYF